MDEIRAATNGGPDQTPIRNLPTQQRRVLELIEAYGVATEQPCPSTVIARRLRLHHSTVQKHLIALHRKGWLRSPGSPAWLHSSRG